MESDAGRKRGRRGVRRVLAVAGVALVGLAACQPLPPQETAGNRLTSGASLAPGQTLYSPTGAFRLEMQTDGNLVLRSRRGFAYWTTKTNGNAGATLVMRGSGALAVQSTRGTTLWSTPTGWITGASMELGDDANLVVKGTAGQPVWASGISTVDSNRVPASQRTVSTHQVVLTKLFEGYVAAKPYYNSNGNCTVGYGHLIRLGTCTSGDKEKMWDADALFATDVTEHARRLKSSLGSVPMTQREFDALFDYVFNRGSLTATSSPGVYKAMTSIPPDYANVVKLIRENGNGLTKGLCNRRYDEAKLFAGGRYDRTSSC